MGIEGLVLTLVYLLLIGLVCYLVFWGLSKLALPEPLRVAILLIMVIVIVVWFVRNVLPGLGLGF